MRGATQSFVTNAPSLSFVLYAPVIISALLSFLLIIVATKGWNSITLISLITKKRAVT
jgi:hypothetical protein